MTDKRTALLAAGGTGGHIFPAQALGEELRARGWDVHLATDSRAERFAGAFGEGQVHVVPSGTFSKNPIRLIKALFKVAKGVRAATRLVDKLKPDVTIGFGGYPSALPVFLSHRAGVPTVIHEANAVLGRANKALARNARAIATGFPLSGASQHASKTVLTGNPVRSAIAEIADQAFVAPTDDEPFELLIFGGSQGAQFFSQIMPEVIAGMAFDLGMRLKITQQARPEDEAELRQWYQDNDIEAEVAPFFEDMPARLSNAHLVISRAGASTVTELAIVGRPAILIPYPHALDHDQATNAKAMADAGGVDVVMQHEATPERLRHIITELMQDPARLAAQAQAAKSTAQPDAARLLADICTAMADGVSLPAQG
jgi:UDP-N-acetylglucosamine--N-acetylmuramyl-(pentapeptide) pyrophosphoryl-undecaprenol N-acetylglucosamine transferase